jgi:RimJ/RimL family protein N-acetyltransferase
MKAAKMKHLETERLIIRRFRPNDWRDLYEYLSQPETVKYEPYEPFLPDQAKQEAQYRSTIAPLIEYVRSVENGR